MMNKTMKLMNHNILKQSALFALLLSSFQLQAQIDTASALSYGSFLEIVSKNNVAYAAKKYNVSISEAQIQSAGILPDPELSFEGVDNGERSMQMGYELGASLGWTIELGGKRKARIQLAKSEHELSKSLLADYFRNLRAEATLQFLTVLQNKMLYQSQLEVYENMRNIARADSLRYAFGEISQVSLRQSKLEAKAIYNEVLQSESAWHNSRTALMLFMNQEMGTTLLHPEGDFNRFDRDFHLNDLIVTAQNQRTDLLAALQDKEVAMRMVNLEKANRKIDLGLNFGVRHATYAHNEVAPTPAHSPVSMGISVPLKFSNRRNADLIVAQYSFRQSELHYTQIEYQIAAEITQAFYAYQAMKKQVAQFQDGMLEEAKAILDGKTYSYRRGETSLLEVLDAQRTFNEIQQKYYETLFHYAASLIELEKAAGIWDIDF